MAEYENRVAARQQRRAMRWLVNRSRKTRRPAPAHIQAMIRAQAPALSAAAAERLAPPDDRDKTGDSPGVKAHPERPEAAPVPADRAGYKPPPAAAQAPDATAACRRQD